MGDTPGGPQQPADRLAERVVELEIKLAYQERLLADLDGVVREFAARVETMGRQLEELSELAARGDQGGDPIGPADEKPPHY